MKIEKKELADCQVELKLVFDESEAKDINKRAVAAVSSRASMPGFRKGKVPPQIVEKEFAPDIAMARVRAMARRAVDAAKEEKIELFNTREITDAHFEDGNWSVTAVVEKRPVFDLPEYKGMSIAPADTTVADDEIDGIIANMRETASTFNDAAEGATAAEGDIIQYDYSAEIDGKPASEVCADAGDEAAQEGAWATLGSNPEAVAADNAAGMKVGETKEFERKFADDFRVEGLRGLKAKCKITLKTLRSKSPATDEQLLKDSQTKDLDELRGKIRENLERRKKLAEERRRYDEAAEGLVSRCDFEVPLSQIDRLADATLEEYKNRALSMGLDAGYLKENREKIQKEARDSAIRQIKAWYIADAICKAEKIECKPEETLNKAVEIVLANVKN